MEKKNKKETKIPLRVNILLLVIFFMFSGLIIQLGIIQIVEGEAYQTEIDRTIEDLAKIPFTRGKIFDSNHNVVVDNEEKYAIMYTPPKRAQASDKLKLAEKLVDYMSVSKKQIDRVTDYNMREYVYLNNMEEIDERLSKEEEKKLKDSEIYRRKLELVTDKELELIDKEQLKVIAIKRELDKAFQLTPQIIKNEDISPSEYARIAENLSDLPGISVGVDWDRKYPYGDLLRGIFGSVTSQEQGIPSEKEDTLLLTGYNPNDRVGRSGLEEYYEEYLRGRKEKVKYTTTKSGSIVSSEVISPGEVGKDLKLTIDMDFQRKVDQIVKEELQKARANGGNRFLTDALTVVMNPKTGDIMAMSGQRYNEETGEIESNPLMTIHDQHLPGSTVKGATVLAGLNTGIISPGQVFHDSPIKIKDTPLKGSYSQLGYLNDENALKRSSNVYMFYIALRMIGEYRHPFPTNGIPTFNREGVQVFLNNFHQYGLGVATGIDFPFESTGFQGDFRDPGQMMDQAIGQYESYTAMQLAQYMSTIANGGFRVKPNLVQSIHYPSINNELAGVYEQKDTSVLNEVQVSESNLKRVQNGFWKVFNESGGTGYNFWRGKKYRPAGKTGTAENRVNHNGTIYKTENSSLAGYAPFEDPEIAFAIIIPDMSNMRNQYPITHQIGTRILDMYFEEGKNEKDESKENDD